jgi:para-nitrobenzyl esterase
LSLNAAEQAGVKLVEAASLPSGDSVLKALRSASVEQLLEAFAKVAGPSGVPPELGINIDGWVLPKSPAEVFASGKQIPASLIVGINAREFMGPILRSRQEGYRSGIERGTIQSVLLWRD